VSDAPLVTFNFASTVAKAVPTVDELLAALSNADRPPEAEPEDVQLPASDLGGRILIDSGASEAGWHRLEAFLRCPQLYSYQHVLNLDLGSKVALVRGSLVHVGLAHYYARRGASQRLRGYRAANGVEWCEEVRHPDGSRSYTPHQITDRDRFIDPHEAIDIVAANWAMRGEPLGLELAPLCHEVVTRYITRFQGAQSDNFKIVGVELPLRTHHCSHLFTGRLDLVFETAQGIVVMDHKTTAASVSDSTFDSYTLSGQMAALYKFGQEKWPNFHAVMINLIGVGKDTNVRRRAPNAAPWIRERFAEIVQDTEEGIARYASRDPWHWPVAANEHVCRTRYGRCPAWELCRWGPGKSNH